MLPLEKVFGSSVVIPETTAWPNVGSAALGSTVQALAPAEEVGHAGAVVLKVAAYADESTPVGVNVAH